MHKCLYAAVLCLGLGLICFGVNSYLLNQHVDDLEATVAILQHYAELRETNDDHVVFMRRPTETADKFDHRIRQEFPSVLTKPDLDFSDCLLVELAREGGNVLRPPAIPPRSLRDISLEEMLKNPAVKIEFKVKQTEPEKDISI